MLPKNDVSVNELTIHLLNMLQNGSGIQPMLMLCHEYLHNPMTVCDTNFSIIYHFPAHENHLDFEIQNKKSFMRSESIQNMQRERIVEKIFNQTKPFTSYRKELACDIMYCSIRIQRAVVGYICIQAQNRTFQDQDYTIAEILSSALSVEMQKNSFFTERAGLKYEYFLIDLIEGNLEDADLVHKRFVQLERHLYPYFHLLVLGFKNQTPTHVRHHYLIDQILQILPNSMVFFYKGHLVALMSSHERHFPDSRICTKLSEFLALNVMTMAVSYQYTALLDTPAYYRQTIRLLSQGLSREKHELICQMSDYAFETLIGAPLEKEDLKALIHPDIHLLAAYDQLHHTEYLETLKTYLANDRNAVKSAAVLCIHKSTFFYRLGKITELAGTCFDNGSLLFNYEISLRILKL